MRGDAWVVRVDVFVVHGGGGVRVLVRKVSGIMRIIIRVSVGVGVVCDGLSLVLTKPGVCGGVSGDVDSMSGVRDGRGGDSEGWCGLVEVGDA